jgi:hypothetical protein
MNVSYKESEIQVHCFNADEELLAELRPGAPFNARASFQAFGERQFGDLFAGVAYCCELPGIDPPRWEAALELKAEQLPDESPVHQAREALQEVQPLGPAHAPQEAA